MSFGSCFIASSFPKLQGGRYFLGSFLNWGLNEEFKEFATKN